MKINREIHELCQLLNLKYSIEDSLFDLMLNVLKFTNSTGIYFLALVRKTDTFESKKVTIHKFRISENYLDIN